MGPIKAGRRYVPPAPGMMARRVSGSPTVAVEAKTRKLVASASSRPPPKAVLEIAEMVGIWRVERRVSVALREVRNVWILSYPSVYTSRVMILKQ